ncbi:MAG TPA: class I SAM-dependent methyltransferase [Candidatus Binatus sp.]|nr:class I SAM-dependent methyltransferase [Candidatus Binatus sp.]
MQAPGGVLIGDVHAYDVLMGLAFGGFYDGVAADVAASLSPGASVLEVGCGPGHLAQRLAERGFEVTGLDLDPAMVERARRAAAALGLQGAGVDAAPVPAFVVGDVASLPFDDGSFDAVVSTLSMHHWDDAVVGIREIVRVLKPGGRALVWDLRPRGLPLHPGLPEPRRRFDGAGVREVSAMPWRWPWRFRLTERVEFIAGGSETS